MDFKFEKFEATPGEKFLGIATVKLYGKIVLRYKIVQTKDGSSYFPAPATYKMPTPPGAKDRYISAFILDSNSENEELMGLIMQNVSRFINVNASVHVAAPAASAGPNLYQQAVNEASDEKVPF